MRGIENARSGKFISIRSQLDVLGKWGWKRRGIVSSDFIQSFSQKALARCNLYEFHEFI